MSGGQDEQLEPDGPAPTRQEAPNRPPERLGIPPALDALTPAMRQYQQFKQTYPDYVLLFRMGDFYEMFYEDAKLASALLGLTLTTRSKGPNAVPLAGIPYHALDSYLAKFIAAGHRVAICEQVEDPRLAKGLVKRDVTRLMTPGTLTEENLLDRREGNYLAAVFDPGGTSARGDRIPKAPRETASGQTASGQMPNSLGAAYLPKDKKQEQHVGIAWVELSSGAFETMLVPAQHVLDELVRIRPSEVIVPDGSAMDCPGFRDSVRQHLSATVTARPAWAFDARSSVELLKEHFRTQTLEGFGFDGYEPSLSAAAAVIDYLRETQKDVSPRREGSAGGAAGALAHIRSLRRFDRAETVLMDGNTIRCLEILRSIRGNRRGGTLLEAIDATCTGMGARLLQRWLTYPLRSYSGILARQDAVEELAAERPRLARIRQLLDGASQIDRIAGNIALGRVRPRELLGLKETLDRLPELAGLLADCRTQMLADIAFSIRQPSGPCQSSPQAQATADSDQPAQPLLDLPDAAAAPAAPADANPLDQAQSAADLIGRSIRLDCPPVLRDGGVIADGFNEDLDRLRRVCTDAVSWLADYQAREIRRTGIASLKVGYNKVFGYYLEVSHANAEKAPADFVRKQTLKNAERYITDELKRYEQEALTASERSKALETRLFEEVRQALLAHVPALQAAAAALAGLDVLACFAHLALERNYRRPAITQENVLEIVGGKHPVLAAALGGNFVPNDVEMGLIDNRLLIITGPNMAGKSTYIRQVALLVLLAQTGCFIPAEEATVGMADRIFTRVGAADELTAGLSTFMVEMIETANILNNATARSLVILDEVGRGTSTYDGLALAWAISEHLALRLKCRALFATHYHELTELEQLLDGAANLNVAVREWADEVVFLHKIVPGGTDRSYGVHVARLAGVPKEVIERARQILPKLQAHLAEGLDMPELTRRAAAAAAQQSLFADPAQRLLREIKSLDLDNMTPMQAWEWLSKWRET